MKRIWLALAVLAVLFGIGLAMTVSMDRIHAPMAGDLQAAAKAALAENWEDAQSSLAQAKQRWEQYRHLAAAAADHTPMEEISAWFARLEALCACKARAEFASGAAYTAQMVEAMGEAHEISWRNLL